MLYTVKRILGPLSVRCTRSKKISTLKTKGKLLCRIRLSPWFLIEENNSCVWIVSMAVSKSNRQINDWMNKRKNKRSYRLGTQLNGKEAMRFQLFAVSELRKWIYALPIGDSIVFKCESVQPSKQFRIWKKWFERKEDSGWAVLENKKGFVYYKSATLELK